MIKPPSLIKPRTDYFSEDSAFTQLEPDATPEATADYSAKLRVALDTGDWTALRVAGAGEPTAFTMKPLNGDTFAKLADAKAGGLGDNELFSTAFACSCTGVTGLGDVQLTFRDDARYGRMADLAFLERAGIVGGLAVRVLRELGGRVLVRAADLGEGKRAG